MKLFNLGKLPGQESMLIFHTLARLEEEALVITSPQETIVSVGYFQRIEEVVDLDFCQRNKISVMRREIGGGATLLDENQIFYQVILKRDNPLVPPMIADIYTKFSSAPIETYKHFGIEVEFRPINDIVTKKDKKKIAGEGGGDIGECMVFVGGILLDFNYEIMSKILKVSDEKFRDKIYKSMEENLTTMKRELGYIPPREKIESILISKFEEILGPLEPAGLIPEIKIKMTQLEREFNSEEFRFKKGKRDPLGIKIREGVRVSPGIYKAPGGLITTITEVKEGKIAYISISGDFTFYPKEKLSDLEEFLVGVEMKREEIVKRINTFYELKGVQSPGVSAEDLLRSIIGKNHLSA